MRVIEQMATYLREQGNLSNKLMHNLISAQCLSEDFVERFRSREDWSLFETPEKLGEADSWSRFDKEKRRADVRVKQQRRKNRLDELILSTTKQDEDVIEAMLQLENLFGKHWGFSNHSNGEFRLLQSAKREDLIDFLQRLCTSTDVSMNTLLGRALSFVPKAARKAHQMACGKPLQNQLRPVWLRAYQTAVHLAQLLSQWQADHPASFGEFIASVRHHRLWWGFVFAFWAKEQRENRVPLSERVIPPRPILSYEERNEALKIASFLDEESMNHWSQTLTFAAYFRTDLPDSKALDEQGKHIRCFRTNLLRVFMLALHRESDRTYLRANFLPFVSTRLLKETFGSKRDNSWATGRLPQWFMNKARERLAATLFEEFREFPIFPTIEALSQSTELLDKVFEAWIRFMMAPSLKILDDEIWAVTRRQPMRANFCSSTHCDCTDNAYINSRLGVFDHLISSIFVDVRWLMACPKSWSGTYVYRQ